MTYAPLLTAYHKLLLSRFFDNNLRLIEHINRFLKIRTLHQTPKEEIYHFIQY